MARRESRWTQIYWDAHEGKLKAYVRLVPDFVDTEAAGFSHGLSIGGVRFATEAEANEFADNVDKFMDAVAKELVSPEDPYSDEAQFRQVMATIAIAGNH